jgi:hypothetical protein
MNKLTKEQDINIDGYLDDFRDFLDQGDFNNAKKLLTDLKKYVSSIEKEVGNELDKRRPRKI